jgi:hypothetical protein
MAMASRLTSNLEVVDRLFDLSQTCTLVLWLAVLQCWMSPHAAWQLERISERMGESDAETLIHCYFQFGKTARNNFSKASTCR